MNDLTFIPITKLRQNAAKVISDLSKNGTSAVIMQRSKPKAVIADYDYFTSLEESVIDLLDSIEAEKRKKDETIPFSEYIKKRWGKSSVK